MPHLPYTTAVHPYAAEMWDSAAEHLGMERGWMEVLMVCPDPDATAVTAVEELRTRGIGGTTALVYLEDFSNCHCIRVSRLRYMDPRWDEVERRLRDNAKRKALVTIDTTKVSADVMIEEARAAMAERGLEVSVGYAGDDRSSEGLLRIELA